MEKLAKKLKHGSELLAQENASGRSAFYLAVLSGVVDNVKVMVEKNPELPNIRCVNHNFPIIHAAQRGRKNTVAYLYKKTDFSMLEPSDRIQLLQAAISYDMYGMHACNSILSNHKFKSSKLESSSSSSSSSVRSYHIILFNKNLINIFLWVHRKSIIYNFTKKYYMSHII